MRHPNQLWHIWIDTGGTFTDCLARDPNGQLHRAKVLSSSALRGRIVQQISHRRFRVKTKWSAPANFIAGFRFRLLESEHPQIVIENYDPHASTITLAKPISTDIHPDAAFEALSPEEAPILAARLVTKTLPQQPLPPIFMRLATTRGANALLERKGAPVALFITKGFGDLLLIGNQQRPDIFALEIKKPAPLYEVVLEVEERLASDGAILKPINLEPLKTALADLRAREIAVAAAALMHSYRNPAHEQALAKFLCAHGFQHVSLSSELAPLIKIVPRAETAVVDAYLTPVIKNYLTRVRSALTNGRLHVMTSAGGLTAAEKFSAKDSLLSGPAGGVVGAALAGWRSGFDKIIAFDMGGTSTDVARFDGDFEYTFEHQVGDAHLVAPALAIESVAAGGGSICWFDGFRLRVGPQSAGAAPGPACYGAGGPLTLTDVNLLLGRLDRQRFEIPVSAEPAAAKFQEVQQAVRRIPRLPGGQAIRFAEKKSGEKIQSETLLQGFLDIANERMADAIRRVSVRKGYDPQEYALVAFGGAGGQHACALAELLGMKTIVVPKDASLLSALGLGHALLERFAEKQVLRRLSDCISEIESWFEELSRQARRAMVEEGIAEEDIAVRRRLIHLRFVGQDASLAIEFENIATLENKFETKYRELYGHLPEARPIEVESVRVVCSTKPAEFFSDTPPAWRAGDPLRGENNKTVEPHPATAAGKERAYFGGEWQEVAIYDREQLSPGAKFSGPALVFEPHTATAIAAGWKAEVDAAGALVLGKA
jgi:5-oxoprolinase (ATP-hydrolysing)